MKLEENEMGANTFTISGYAGSDPDAKYFESGRVLATVSVAVRRTKEITDWFTVEAWSRTAELMLRHVRKGTWVEISGQLEIQTWQDRQTGEIRSKPVVKVYDLGLGPKSASRSPSGGYGDEF